MRFFLTGAAGFSGFHLTQYLAQQGHTLFAQFRGAEKALARAKQNYSSSQQVLDDSITWIDSDLTEVTSLPSQLDGLIHLAATSPGRNQKTGEFVRDNVLGTAVIARLCREFQVPKVLYFSSLSVNGVVTSPLVDEQTPIINPDAYGATKFIGEKLFEEQAPEVATLVLRLPALLGRGATRNWIVRTAHQALRNEMITIFNPDASFDNSVDIDDLCVFVSKILNFQLGGFDVVTVAAAGQMTIKEVVELMILKLKSSSKIVVQTPPPRIATRVSSEKAIRLYNYNPRPVREMIEKYLKTLM